ncbi:MAG: polyphosphate polymerase domain-containing protein [Bacteroidia bacterium]
MVDKLKILEKFEPISLKEMDSVKLMDRTDTKFTFNHIQFELILSEILEDYRVLEVDGKRISRYKTLYYDTGKLDLYTKHHNGELNRYKIRHRSYLESNIGFLEVKFKNNKGRTVKNRIKKSDVPLKWENDTETFLTEMLPFEPDTLLPVIWVNYSRLTLVNKKSAERLTIDLDLEFVKDDVTKKLGSLVIAEVKQEKRKASPFLKIMRKYHIREGSISKYCLGIALTCNDVKKNNFKAKIQTLKHIIYDDLVANS